MRKARERVEYWQSRRFIATTEKELRYCHRMEAKAHAASSKANQSATP